MTFLYNLAQLVRALAVPYWKESLEYISWQLRPEQVYGQPQPLLRLKALLMIWDYEREDFRGHTVVISQGLSRNVRCHLFKFNSGQVVNRT